MARAPTTCPFGFEGYAASAHACATLKATASRMAYQKKPTSPTAGGPRPSIALHQRATSPRTWAWTVSHDCCSARDMEIILRLQPKAAPASPTLSALGTL